MSEGDPREAALACLVCKRTDRARYWRYTDGAVYCEECWTRGGWRWSPQMTGWERIDRE